jgi:hypothetical protein
MGPRQFRPARQIMATKLTRDVDEPAASYEFVNEYQNDSAFYKSTALVWHRTAYLMSC